ncbi:DUF2273 domain-containing protein [Planococcus sp. ISL-109]|uniref:DUF2273 domain-containing protein n=1 Tax=Planococcus sp. ISL-109 TaxID=2819166 RepID=UPI001BE544E5|nr:DUF2273 domain-containing protein [Planococcus sp. ISL-109]MBT2583093.1 DUF2273 domain-containing protein [Planococcus sp. ISL-109]
MKTSDYLMPYHGRLAGLLIGVIIASLFLTIDVGPTLFILACAAIGYIIGKWKDGKLDTASWFQFLKNKR